MDKKCSFSTQNVPKNPFPVGLKLCAFCHLHNDSFVFLRGWSSLKYYNNPRDPDLRRKKGKERKGRKREVAPTIISKSRRPCNQPPFYWLSERSALYLVTARQQIIIDGCASLGRY